MKSGSCSHVLTVALTLLLAWLEPSVAQVRALQVRSTNTRRYYEHEVNLDENKHNDEFFNFVTRPDLNAPRWNIEVLDEDAIAPGHWFTAPYSNLVQSAADAPWNAPHIYDSNGDLIWSGAPLFDGFTTFDFRVSQIQGQPMLSVVSPRGGQAFIFTDAYETYKIIDMGDEILRENEAGLNSHEFTTVENGAKALYLTRLPKRTSKKNSEAVNFDGECFAIFDGIRELDTSTWNTIHTWNSENYIGLDESFADQEPVGKRCASSDGWDFLHLNSVDTFSNGDYLVSGRRSNTLYRISRSTGEILWRLGGKRSSFKFKVKFSGQHAAKVYEENATHILLSLLDNAFLPPANPQTTISESRGLLLALDMTSMIVHLVEEFPHPEGGYATSRGNMQMLPNENAWICWTDGSLQSEYTLDGRLIMKSRFKAGISSYRTFKFPWIGRPKDPPDVHAAIVDKNGQWYTIVHMSWNGATEVRSWRVYHMTADGSKRQLVATVKRRGFETLAWTPGYGKYVVTEALDQNDEILGTSHTFSSLSPRNRSQPILTPSQRLEDESRSRTSVDKLLITFIFGVILGCVFGSMASGVLRRTWSAVRLSKLTWRSGENAVYAPIVGEHEEGDVELEPY